MKRKLQGRYVTISVIGDKFQAFVPAPLPPSPPIQWTPELRSKFESWHGNIGIMKSIIENHILVND